MRSNPLRWLLLAGAIHITLTVAIFLIGYFQLLPSVVDPNGTGLSFALDATSYRSLASQMATDWQTQGTAAWLQDKAPFHCRLYSILFLTFGRLLGHNILAAEPLNLPYYIGILTCVYFLGREIFSTRAGLVAAVIVGLWPSFLLHTTQLIRDPIAILCLLALLLVFTSLLARVFAWRASLVLGTAGAVLVTLFWVVRGNMWNIVVLTISITVVLLLARMIRRAQFLGGNLIALVIVIGAMLLVPSRLESTALYGTMPPTTPFAIPSSTQPAPRDGLFTRAIRQIGDRRSGFRLYRARGSNIDSDVQLDSVGDVLRFVPRATVIGFFAPFPRLWLQQGSFGRAGRLLSGVETLLMYLLYVAAAVCVWRNQRRLEMWLLFLVATIGTIALGLVVANAGALYRLRYVFWIMFIIMAAETLSHLTIFRTNETKSRISSSVVSNDAMNRHSDVSSSQT